VITERGKAAVVLHLKELCSSTAVWFRYMEYELWNMVLLRN